MKVVVQNGANSGLTRSEVEAMLPFFPASWKAAVSKIMLVSGNEVSATHYPKEKLVSVCCPSSSALRDKAQATTALIYAVARAAKEEPTEEIRTSCLSVLKQTSGSDHILSNTDGVARKRLRIYLP